MSKDDTKRGSSPERALRVIAGPGEKPEVGDPALQIDLHADGQAEIDLATVTYVGESETSASGYVVKVMTNGQAAALGLHDQAPTTATVGWTPAYDANYDAIFQARKPETDPSKLS